MSQDVGASCPESGDGGPDRRVGRRGAAVDVAGVGDLALRGRGCRLDFAVGEGAEGLVGGRLVCLFGEVLGSVRCYVH